MNLFKEAYFTPPPEEAEFMCVLRRETEFLQAYSMMSACKSYSQKDREAQTDKQTLEVILYFLKIFHLPFSGS